MDHLDIQDYSSNPELSSIIKTILLCSLQISDIMQNTVVHKIGSTNAFGDEQLHLDVESDSLIEKHLRENPAVAAILSEERPEYMEIGKGKYIVSYDPLDGSSILDTNFAIGSIFAIWSATEQKLLNCKTSDVLVSSILVVYGPRTTAIIYNDKQKAVQQFTLVKKQWLLTQNKLQISPTAKIFSPGNLRSASQNKQYQLHVNRWIQRGLTLRYTGGLVPDVNQIFIKGNGIFIAVASKSHKAKLRVLYEVAAIVFLIQKAGGKTVARNCKSAMDYVIKGYDDRLEFACGSGKDVEELQYLLL